MATEDIQKRDIVVIGASAGGVTALIEIVKTLPGNFKGYIFIVLHLSPYSPSMLPEILTKSGPLEALHPKDGEKLQSGKIYVASPDHHMLIEEDHVVVKRGPKENRFRPSIDALFRSAAYIYGPRVLGIVLTGMLNDGTSGLWSIKRLGGLTIIQEPQEATFPEMPLNVLDYVEVDHVAPVTEIGYLICKLTDERAPDWPNLTPEEMKLLKMEVVISTRDNAFEMGIMGKGILTPFTCPECHGALIRLKEGKIVRFRCHTGHAYTASSLLAGISESVEEMLWQAMRGLEEGTMLLNQMGEHFKEIGQENNSKLFSKKASDMADRARVIHDSVFRQEQINEDIRHQKKDE